MKLGKLAPKQDKRTLLMAKYLLAELPAPPEQVEFTSKVNYWGMMDNDTIGDCTCAAAGHLIEQWMANAGTEQQIADSSILAAYEAITGYNGNPATDKGAVEIDVLNYWRNSGIANHKIGAYVSINPLNQEHVKQAIWIFGGAYIGLALPLSAQNQDIWDVSTNGLTGNGEPGSWGGHAVSVAGFDANDIIVVTWGSVKRMTWAFWRAYVDEAYAIISADFLVNGKTPNNSFDLATLNSDLTDVTS